MAIKCLSEYLGTLILVFAGTSAIVVDDVTGGAVSNLGVAIVFGLAVAAMIYAFGDSSGAHINPAVTLALWYAKRFNGTDVVPYVASQIAGALSASAVVYVLFATHPTLGATRPGGTAVGSFVMETVITFFLVLTVIALVTGARRKGVVAASVGGVIGVEAWFAGPISGASMNPARSIGPALVSGQVDVLWIYIAAPIIGACLAVVCCRHAREQGCCG
ncbi:MAG: MIP/aquaporin family protein [Nitrospirota bacterium]